MLKPSSIQKILETFEKEEKEKAGPNILAKYSDYQVNKVPKKQTELAKFPALYQLYVQDQDYQNLDKQVNDIEGSSSRQLSSG